MLMECRNMSFAQEAGERDREAGAGRAARLEEELARLREAARGEADRLEAELRQSEREVIYNLSFFCLKLHHTDCR